MFDREGFIDYVGAKSGNSYASGLVRIESLYSVGIDAEYDKDKCEALLAQIEGDKKRTDLDQKELKKRSDAASHLKRYITFKTNSIDTITDRIHFVIDHYKEHFDAVDQGERYKWEAIAWYKKHWEIDSPSFAQMLEEAFGKAKNLLASAMYYPYRMITEYAQVNPEEVRRIFRILYDESLPLEERYQVFRDSCKSRIDQIKAEHPDREKPLNHYQDLRAIMVYLTFEYPEKYYFFKSTMYSDFRDRIGFREEKSNQSSVIGKVENFVRLCEMILVEIKKDQELILMHKARLDDDCYADEALHLLAMDIVFYGSNYMSEKDFNTRQLCDEPKEVPMHNELSDPTQEPVTDVGLNTILYGPPGTGKTYHTVIYAVAIIENRSLAAVEKENYAEVLERYNEYKAQGRIEFTTFHQSYGYEEFIEGIRPTVTPDDTDGESGDIQYSVQPGVFKRFCERSERPIVVANADYGISDSPNIWKVSLEGTGDNPTRTECLKNNHIRIGWDDYGKDITDETDFSVSGGRVVLNAFINKMQVGDIVLSCYSASTIDAIGVVTGEYEWHDEYTSLKRLRKVNWIVKDIRENILAINGGTSMTLASVYRLNISLADVYQLIEKYQPKQISPVNSRSENYVFIIDEINRGNISKIFGELITLIEATKRVGCPEGMTVRLPYSQKLFGVPKNVYIIGTMNTADRSIATIDTALRRRFLFREMLPVPKVLADISVEDLSISELLTRLNMRITVLYDREHTIGHAYFMPLKASPTVETLAEIFTNNIIPLLQEYFYEDYEKIRLVLGDNKKSNPEEQFIVAKGNDYAELFGDIEVGLDDGYSYEINHAAFGNIEAYRSI